MSTVADFNIPDNCDKIDALCIDAYAEFGVNQDNPTELCLNTSWGSNCVDLDSIVKEAETCTTMYLSPEENPNCLVYEPECGDNICIHGDDLSKIISMKYLKDVDSDGLVNGAVYMYDSATSKFKPFDLTSALSSINTAIQGVQASLSNHLARIISIEATLTDYLNRIVAMETKLTPPAGAPSGVGVVFGNINNYSDPNVVINESTGEVTSLDKTHGLYSHTLSSGAYGDNIFG